MQPLAKQAEKKTSQMTASKSWFGCEFADLGLQQHDSNKYVKVLYDLKH